MNCPRCGTSNLDNLSDCVRCGAALVPAGEAATFIGISLPPTPAAKAGTAAAPAPAPPPPPRQGDGSNVATAGPWAALGIASSSDHVDFGPRYRIDRLLGQGGMGAVYKAWDKELERPVALKLIRPELAVDPAVEQRFKQELLLASKISHKNILRIHDLGEAAGVKFITMAFVEGQDLHQLLAAEGKLTLERTLKIARQLCGALEAAHNEGVVHRDFKPQNILLDKQENVYVSDFGLAKSLEHDTGMTKSGEFLGTPRYMAPEQVQGGKIDHRADLYALGLILYEMVTGDVPFHADTTLQLMYKRVHEVPKSPKTLNPDLPDWITGIIMKCLERNPDQRYQNAAEILQDINAGVAPPTVAKTESRQFTFALPVMSRARWAGVIAAILVVAIAIGALVLRRFKAAGPGSGKPVTVLVADFENKTSDGVFDGTLEPAFGLALEGASFISTYNRGQAHKIAAQLKPGASVLDEAAARLIAVREGINVIVTGTITADGAGYKLASKAEDGVSGKEISSQELQVQSKDAVLKAVGSLANEVRNSLGDKTPESVLKVQAETFTSGSLEAAHEYSLAQDLQWAGSWSEAAQHYRKAIELDPKMGRAYAGLAAISINTGRRQDAEKYYQQAMSLVDRMSDREKYRTRGGYYLTVREPQKAIEEYTALVKQYPADASGYGNLALAYFYMRDMQKALQEGRHAVEVSPKNLLQRDNVALYAVYAGDFATGAKEAQTVLEQNPSFALAYNALAMAQMGLGHPEEAEQTFQKLQSLNAGGASMAAIGLADALLFRGLADQSISLLEKAIAADIAGKDNNSAAAKYIVLAQAHLLGGHSSQAQAAAEKAIALDKGESVLYSAGQIYLEAGQLPRAAQLATQLSSRIEPEPQVYGKLLEGETALKRKEARQAISFFQAAQKMYDTWLGHYDLGRAYLDAGMFTEADSEFELCLRRKGEASAVFLDDVPTFRIVPLLYYYLGRAQEGLKSPAAADSYKTFIAFQEKGVGPLLADARRRLNSH
jgi:tetratricopeptide (TPR) repeat protein/predicted Ser/Thr protein kinase